MSKASKQQIRNIHPGEVLREEFLIPLGITQYRLAQRAWCDRGTYLSDLHRQEGDHSRYRFALGRFLNGFTYAGDFVAGQIIGDDDIAWRKGGA